VLPTAILVRMERILEALEETELMRATSITVSIRLVDGGLQEFREGPGFLERLRSLQARGVQGKALIEQLISDDWAAAPEVVIISGVADGEPIDDIVIPYV